MKKDYYSILGVDPWATEEQLKKAYRERALRSHPDRHPDDPEAHERFQAIIEAYETLSDPMRRWQYDHHGAVGEEDNPALGAAVAAAPQRRRYLPWLVAGLVALAAGAGYAAARLGGDPTETRDRLLIAMADSLFEAADYAEARNYYAQVLRRVDDPHAAARFRETMRYLSVRQQRGAAAEQRGDSLMRQAGLLLSRPADSAATGTTTAASLYSQANEAYLEALRHAPADAELLAKGQRATEALNQALALADASSVPAGRVSDLEADVQDLLYTVYKQQGDLLVERDDLIGARSRFRRALRYKPRDAYARDRLLYIQRQLDRRALDALPNGGRVQVQPPQVPAPRRLGGSASDDSTQQYETLRLQGDVRASQGDWQGAIRSYRRALLFRPGDRYVAQRIQALRTPTSQVSEEQVSEEQVSEEQDDLVEQGAYLVTTEPPVPEGGLEALYRRVVFPQEAHRAGIRGSVLVRFVVDVQGRVQRPQVLRSLGFGCDQAVLRALRRTRFQPGRYEGTLVDAWMTLPFLFQAEQDS